MSDQTIANDSDAVPDAPEDQVYEPPEDLSPPEPVEDDPDGEDEDREPPEAREHGDEEDLEPKVDPVVRVLTDERGQSREYVQKPLEYFQSIELYGLFGEMVDIVLQGESPLGIDQIMQMAQPRQFLDRMMAQMPGSDTAPTTSEERDVSAEDIMKILQAFARVVAASPDTLKRMYCIVLGIPKAHRMPWAMEWAFPLMSRETGIDILETFVDQNWDVVEDFFFRELPRTVRRAAKARQRSATARSKL